MTTTYRAPWTKQMVEDAADLADFFADVCGEKPCLDEMMVNDIAKDTTQLFIESSIKAVLQRRVDLPNALLGAIAWGIFVAEAGKTKMLGAQPDPS